MTIKETFMSLIYWPNMFRWWPTLIEGKLEIFINGLRFDIAKDVLTGKNPSHILQEGIR